MRILQINIEEFGKLRERNFRFGEGINVIFGANESGKSTLLAFLRFAFYGFPRRNGVLGEERDMRLSWQGHRAAGTLLFEDEGVQYRITRSVTRQGSVDRESFSEQLCVVQMPGGEDVALNGKTPGEYFLGIPATLYDSTMYLRQSDAARVSSPEVGEAMGEMLFSGASGSRADAAAERLRMARRELAHQKGNGGKINELRAQIAETEEQLRCAKEDAIRLTGYRTAAESYRVQLEEQRRALESINESFEQAGVSQMLALFEDVHEAERQLAGKKLQVMELDEQQAQHPLPTAERLEEVNEALRAHAAAIDAGARMTPDLERARGVRYDEGLLAAHVVLEERGGVRHVQEEFAATKKRRKRTRAISLASLTLGLLFAAFGCLLATGLLDVLLNYLPAGTYMIDVCAAVLLTAGVLLLLSLFFCFRALFHRRRMRVWCRAVRVEEPAMFRTYLERCAEEASAKAEHQAILDEMEREYTALAKEALAAEARIREVLVEAGYQAQDCTVEAAPALLREISALRADAANERARAVAELERATAVVDALRRRTEGYDEEELRARADAMLEKGSGVISATGGGARERQARLRESIQALESKRAEALREEIALAATVKDPAESEAELQRLYTERDRAEHRLAVLNLALEALEEAVSSLHKGVTPRLCEVASAHFEKLTGGAHKRLYPAADLSLMLESDKGPLPLSHFSAGCRDAAHLALRLGLLSTITQKQMPLLFDEAFARLDDERTSSLLALLCSFAEEGGQSLLFTCHTREAELLEDADFTYITL